MTDEIPERDQEFTDLEATAEVNDKHLFQLVTLPRESGKWLIALDEFEPSHLSRIFQPDIAEAVAQSMFATAKARAEFLKEHPSPRPDPDDTTSPGPSGSSPSSPSS